MIKIYDYEKVLKMEKICTRIILTILLLIIVSINILPQKTAETSDDTKINNEAVLSEDSSDQKKEIVKNLQEEKRKFKNAKADLDKNELLLTWTFNNETGIVNYLIEKINTDEREIIGVIKAKGNINISSDYEFSEILNVEDMEEDILIYRVSAADTAGKKILWKEFKLYPSQMIDGFDLQQNYPNPFNPVTKIKYSVPFQEHVSIKVFNILGNEVKTLVDEVQPGGTYEVEFNASGLTSGVYLYTLQMGELTETKRMILMK